MPLPVLFHILILKRGSEGISPEDKVRTWGYKEDNQSSAVLDNLKELAHHAVRISTDCTGDMKRIWF